MASIRERVSKGGERSWAVLYRVGKRQTSETFPSPESAERFRQLVELLGPERALATLAEDNEAAVVAAMITVDELAQRFMEWKTKRVTDRTANDYERDYKNWIRPTFGHRPADLITELDVQDWIDWLEVAPRRAGAKGSGPIEAKTIAGHHMLLHSIYQFGSAKVRRLVSGNPCLETELPTRKKKPPKGTTVPEFMALLAAAREMKAYDAHDLILYLGETGWRFSEATALGGHDVEDDDHDVWTTVTRVYRTDRRGKQILTEDEAKSYAAFRRIRMLNQSRGMLQRRLLNVGPGDLVFTNSRGTPWNQNTFLRETWPRIRRRAGVDRLIDGNPVTPHHLRHMHVAVLSAAGVPIQEIQRRIGHESIATTIGTYGGLIGDMSNDALNQAVEIMAGARFVPGVAPAPRRSVEAPIVRGELVSNAPVGG